MSKTVLDSLRSETRELHRRTEQALDLPRSSASITPYASLLRRLLGFYEPLEASLFGSSHFNDWAGGRLESRRKSPALRADIAILGPTPMPEVERCSYIPDLQSGLTLAGAWYVVEGATRGGQVISRHLDRQLGLTRQNGASFFDCYGEERERNWDEFCGLLDTIPMAQADEVTAGAVAVFSAMHRWLAERPVPARAKAG